MKQIKMDIKHLIKKKGKRILLLFLVTLLPFIAPAQRLTAVKTTIDVGKTGYQQPVTATFEFRNKSLWRLKIEDVKPDCSCTVVDYPKDDIGMGDKFQIRMTYDAKQLGHFDKQAAIISNGSKKPIYIRMKGIVLEDYVDVTSSYPIAMGDLMLNTNELEFDNVNKGDQLVQELNIYNNGTRAYEPNLMHLPSYLTVDVQPEKLSPRRAGKMVVTLNSANLHDYGLTQTSVYLAGNPGDKVTPDHEISISTVLLPAFTGMTAEQRQYAGHVQLSKESVNIQFGGKTKKTDVIDVTNTGQSELNISSLQMFTSGLKISLGRRRLQPGESTKLRITAIREELLKARIRPRILMITNDPEKPKVTINISCTP